MSQDTQATAAIAREAVASTSTPPSPPSADFDAIWDEAGLGLEDLAAPEKSGPERSSMLSDIAQHQRSVLENAYAPMDEAALAKMPLLQLQTYLTQRKIDSNYASALLDANWNVLKSARQSVDTVLNSK